ncbi:peptidase M48 Ste24p [Anaeromyxobacter dehalogenans 2CP-1]|uniref:Peptidase M48 Ste24p n=1 Tax=Anaeromyxobacter dehalogenans (strain ATCC BAA-258 / DSM 21875 / 2CP-1) TaxID=455488 RepID=B8JG52_ANAD2|nr:M48 family metalloprotease [Anaeromyxobacter dehalogenans]ACL66455.1 peptidase M48 Ste24p [Anaeromyxobacter dehalogenans 2CP-1]
MALDPRLVSPKEKPLFVAGAIFSGLVWLVAVVSVVGLLYALLGALFVLGAHALFLAHVRTNAVRVDERQLPDLHARVKAAAARLGLADVPAVYVMNGGGLLNAFATKLLSRRYVILLSDLVDHCEDPRQVDFVVGHELGHFAAGHLKWNAFLLPYALVPWLGAAYARAREYTCDRCGLAAAGDLEQSMRGLVVLSAGGRIAARVDLAAFASQRDEAGAFWPTVLELTSYHPFLSKRVAALHELSAPGSARPVRRSVAGWIFAPALGALGGGAGAAPVMVVAIVGMLAAIAIPNFVRYQLKAKDAGAQAALEALYRAEVAAHEKDGSFRELQLGEAATRTPAAFADAELAAARELGWQPPAGGHHVYTVGVGRTQDGRQAFAACAESDADGDGVYAAWMVWEPLEDGEGNLIAPGSPCRFQPKLARQPVFGEGDAAGVPVRVSPEDVF